MSKDFKKEVQEAPLLWPLTPIPTFEEVYDPKICTEASREISTIFEGWLHPKHEMAKPEALGKIRVLECGHGGLQVNACLLYTSDAADDLTRVDLGGRRIIKE